MTRRKKRALVVGGGIAGLACAYDLAKDPGWEVTLAEGSRRLGGKILSEEAEGLVLEGGPDSFLTAKPEALALARELGLAERLLPTNAVDKDVFVYTRGALRRFPEGLMLLAPSRLRSFLASDLLPWTAKLRMALEPL
ncbi:MAG TPA: FAD-dependent oxidoreductase, partial [Elusimicrobiota bacterium]|nr:FAD-dependent oxidoreductase [Elusimicrobiota bacterium]